jgi:chromosome segregation ATPase
VTDVVNADGTATTEMMNAVNALRDITADAVAKMNAGADTLYVASSDFAKAGQGVAGTLNQAAALTGQLTQSAGAVQASTRSLDAAVTDYKSVRETLARMIDELKTTVQAAKTEASFTQRVLGDITAAAEKLTSAQREADDYLSKVNEVLAQAHDSFTTGLQKSLTEAHKEFYKEISRATKALSSSIQELDGVLAALPVTA